MLGFTKYCNCQATKEAEMVLVAIVMIFILFQTNDVSVVFYVVRKVRGVSK